MIDDRCILVVDDESESLALLTEILAAEGYQVRCANSGRLALASLATWLPQLILLDVRVHDIDGFQICRRIKACERTRDIPLMFISAVTDVQERVAGFSLGAVDYITKPFQREELLARVRTHLELGQLRGRLEERVEQKTIELRATIERLRESEKRFRKMADTAPVMIWVAGVDKRCTFFNKRWLDFTGRSLKQELGNGWAEGLHLDDVDRCVTTYSSAFESCQRYEIEYRLRRADGEYRSVLSNGVPNFLPSGVFAGYIGSAIDITDLKRLQEETLARQKLESLAVLTRGIAHDFNNLLGSIIAEAELAEIGLTDGFSPHEEIRQVKTLAIRASEIVRELMIYSGQEKGDLEAVKLSEFVEEMLDLLRASISKHVTLRLDLCRDLPPVRGNATKIRQMLMNLIINASQAIGEKDGVICVRTSRVIEEAISHERVRLEISDTGCGMSKEEKARIFDPFFTTRPGGHGLGLAVVHGIIQSHGGSIHVESTLGSGTTFHVLLPCTEARAELTAPGVSSAKDAQA